MKRIVFCFLVVLNSPVVIAQQITRLYAFSQEIIPGVAPANEGEIPRQKKHYDYLVYIECKRAVQPKIKSIRLKDVLYNANAEEVASPVVQFHSTTLHSDTLIKKTSNKLYKVVLGGEKSRMSRDTSGVTLTYCVRGKTYVYRQKRFIELAPVALP